MKMAVKLWVVVGLVASGLSLQGAEILPLGQVRPTGWLREELEKQAQGLTGHAEELYDDIGRSDWLTGAGVGKEFAWERGPYYAKGLVSLAFVLDDAGLKDKAKRWVDAMLSSQRENGDFGPKDRNWWANMIALWMLRDWCEATGDERVVPFLERYFAFQREAFKDYPLAAESKWAVARAGDELDVVLWLWHRTGKDEWRDFAKSIAAQSADWTTYYYRGGDPAGPNENGCRSHIVNFMQGLKTPALQYLLDGDPKKRGAYAAAFDPKGWVMRQCGRPDRMINGSEPMSDRSASQGTELCAVAERILSCQTVIAAIEDVTAADDLEIVAYNSLPATLGDDGKGMRYYCLLNQPSCEDKYLCFANNGGRDGVRERNGSICPGPHSGFGCCRSNFHLAWPKFVQSMWMRKDGGLAAVAYGPCRLETRIADRKVVIDETTDYPFDGRVTLRIVEGGGRFPIFVRVPSWCPDSDAGRFRRYEREWQEGDVVTLSFAQSVTTSHWDADAVCVQRGPLLFAYRPEHSVRDVTRYQIPFEDRWTQAKDFPRKEIVAAGCWNYALVLDSARQLAQAEIVGEDRDLRLRVKAIRSDFGGWGYMRDVTTGRAVDPPASPIPGEGALEEMIELVPMGRAQVRVVLFPWIHGRMSGVCCDSQSSCRDPLAEAREVLWTTLRDRFFCEKTEMLYDVLWRADDGTVSATACLPTPEEVARQYPNPCSWGTGLQDCVFNGGPYLAVALARGDREAAQSIFRGLRRCAEVSGVPGFVARGVLPSDGKGYYYNSSRDVWTLFVFYLWRYCHSDLCDAPTRETIRRLVVDVARYAESCVRPENRYNMLRADGKVGLATQMWVKNPKCQPKTDKAGWDFFEGLRVHEALRLPMFYAAAFDLSGDAHWREMALRYLDDGIAMAGGKIGPDIRASVLNQMQLSNRLLWETETDPGRKTRLLRLLNRAADIARDHVTTRLAHDFAAGKWQVSKPIPDWHKAGFRSRNWGDGGVLNGYRYDIPDQPVFSIEDGYVEASHALLVQAMTPDRKIDGRTLRLFREATERLDLSEIACANAVNALLAMYQ